MVDIHSHLLFQVDDGSKDLKSSLELLDQGKKLGFKKIVLTSHFIGGKYENENYEKKFIELKRAIEKCNLDMEVFRGNEVFLDESIDRILEEKKFNTLNDTKYILVEFSIYTTPNVGEVLLKKVLTKGYIPILAHVERYGEIKGSDLLKYRKLGVKLQMNIASGKNLKGSMLKLLQAGKIDLLGSDAHGYGSRNYVLQRELNIIGSLIGEKNLNRIVEKNGEKILQGEEFNIEEEAINEEEVSNRNFFRSIIDYIFARTWNRGNPK